jgi:hypothetical protein
MVGQDIHILEILQLAYTQLQVNVGGLAVLVGNGRLTLLIFGMCFQ